MDTSEAPAAPRGRRRGGEKTGSTGPLAILTEAGLWLLLVATPLALGSVSETATVLMEGACFALLILGWWANRGREASGVPRSFKILAAGFVFWTLFQMVPLPPSLLRWVSPGTHRLYARDLPGYSEGSAPVDLQSWLLQRGDTPSRDLKARPVLTGVEGQMPIASRWKPISWYPEKTLRWLIRFLAYWAIFVLVVEFVPERACRRRLPWLLFLLGLGIAVEGLLQQITWNGRIYWFVKIYQGFPYGPWVNRNHFCGYMEMILPLGVAVLLQGGLWRDRGKGRRHSRRNAIPRTVLVLFCLAWIGAAVVMSGSRGGIFSVFFTAALYLMIQALTGEWKTRSPRTALVLAALPLLVMAGAVATTLVAPARQASADSPAEISLIGRIGGWKGIVSMVAADPLGGTGLGTFPLAFPVFKPYGNPESWQHAENDYLQVLAESGLAGFFLLGIGLFLMFRRFLLPVLLGPWQSQEPVALGAALGLVSLLIHSFVENNLQIPSNGLLFVVIGGLLVRFHPATRGSGTEAAGTA